MNINTTVAEIENYKGYRIETKPNGEGHISLIYKGKKFVGGTAADLVPNGKNSIVKAKSKIDKYHA